MHFWKYHALGNDYLVVDDPVGAFPLTDQLVRRICDRHYGVGSDGVLLPVPGTGAALFGLRIFNPDGTQAERSGNGLRIFARYLWDTKRVDGEPFTVATQGGDVRCQIFEDGRMVTVEMGAVRFHSDAIPVLGPPREVLRETTHRRR